MGSTERYSSYILYPIEAKPSKSSDFFDILPAKCIASYHLKSCGRVRNMSPWTYLTVMCTVCIGTFITSIIVYRRSAGERFGWISPDGRIFKCGPNGHASLAKQLVGEVHPTSNPEKHLMGRGWVKFSKACGKQTKNPHFSVGIGENKKLTDAQIVILEQMGFDRLLEFSSYQFERQIIQGCREIGMSDDEIVSWMKEI